MNSYDVGDAVRLVGTFTNTGGTLTDPTGVTLVLRPPVQPGALVPGTLAYTYASGSVAKQATGSYTFDLSPLPVGTWGRWQYTWVGTGAVVAAAAGQFNVRQPIG